MQDLSITYARNLRDKFAAYSVGDMGSSVATAQYLAMPYFRRAAMLSLMPPVLAIVIATGADLISWTRFGHGGHPDYLAANSLAMDASWCSWHEGVPLFVVDVPVPASRFRVFCSSKQEHNGAAKRRIDTAPNDELAAVLSDARSYFNIPGNGGYEMARTHVRWVMYHENKWQVLVTAARKNRLDMARSQYESAEKHNPHVHLLLAAMSDTALSGLILDLAKDQVSGAGPIDHLPLAAPPAR